MNEQKGIFIRGWAGCLVILLMLLMASFMGFLIGKAF